jgi:uncharacterized protein (DUF433 family)
MDMQGVQRIMIDPEVLGGKPCIRGMRVTVGMVVESMAAGRTVEQLLEDFPHLEEADIRAALAFAAHSRKATTSHLQTKATGALWSEHLVRALAAAGASAN